MNTRALFFLAVALMLTIPQMASAQQVPAEVPIQAFLADDNGVPVDGTVTVDFAIYDSASGGTELHREQATLDAEAGAFTAYITPDLSIFEDNQELYLGLAVDGGSEMTPRLQMATVPYAAVAGTAGDAATLGGMTSSDFAPADYQLNANCSNGEILKWDGSAWACAADEGATYAAGAGLSLSGSDFSVDYTDTQRRVTDSCGSGEYITGINEDGTVVCAPASVSGSVTADDFNYSSAVTRSVAMPASAFQPRDDSHWTWHFSMYYAYATSGTSYAYMTAPVQIPTGSTIDRLQCYIYRSTSAEAVEMTIRLYRTNLTNFTAAGATLIASDDLSPPAVSELRQRTISGINETVDNTESAYHLSIRLDPGGSGTSGSGMRFYGCNLEYQTDTPAP